MREALECLHPCDEVGIEEEVEDEICNYGAEVAAAIQKIESNAVLIAELSHQVSLLRQQICNAPSKTIQRPSSSSSIPPRSRSRTPIRSPQTAKSTQTSPPLNNPYVSSTPKSLESSQQILPQSNPNISTHITPAESPKIPQKTPLEQTPPVHTPPATFPATKTPPPTSPAAKTPPTSTLEAKGGDGDTDNAIDVYKLYVGMTDGTEHDKKYIIFFKFL